MHKAKCLTATTSVTSPDDLHLTQ